MVVIHFFMQVIIEDRKISVCTLDGPVCHVLPGDMQAVTFKLLFLTVKRDGIDVGKGNNPESPTKKQDLGRVPILDEPGKIPEGVPG